ncbi:hypothetical protein [Allobaculum sp. Allo2]|uniref:hypothetical protein n=1 Tax=Allobaculum sp. Allo2 TaxID=2853432 RepID=UPI001F60B360|nr:hypothetical protein [Allobaculum sp. Allo2]UNT94380.1 hypothetical protein KWG61_07335 [Allobaculum sp. Allo2]
MDVHTIEEDPVRHLCLSQIDLHTGRFHQIRATLAHFHTPLARDVKYGDKKEKAITGCRRGKFRWKTRLLKSRLSSKFPKAKDCP